MYKMPRYKEFAFPTPASGSTGTLDRSEQAAGLFVPDTLLRKSYLNQWHRLFQATKRHLLIVVELYFVKDTSS